MTPRSLGRCGDLLSQEAYIRTDNNATGTMAYETVHWDGDTLLFTTNNAGALDDIKTGGLANFVVSSGTVKVAFTDRHFSGGDRAIAHRCRRGDVVSAE
ncbi:MAG: hypothetical protein ACYDBO_06455, partial [Vulcanimicrobiaceae bacterium]